MTVFVDSNIPMYLVGADHPNKHAAAGALDFLIARAERLVTDVEVFQEILHRYGAIGRRDAIQPSFDLISAIVDQVFDVRLEDVEAAKSIMLTSDGLSARDSVHLAVMQANDVERILTFDTDFDRVPGLIRISG